eukprot:12921980-Ditylum_brightwellii.AAC.2
MGEDRKENYSKNNAKNKEEGTKNNKEEKETKMVDINARNEEEGNDPVPVQGKTITEQIIEAGEKDIGKRNVQVTTICVEFKLKKTGKHLMQGKCY